MLFLASVHTSLTSLAFIGSDVLLLGIIGGVFFLYALLAGLRAVVVLAPVTLLALLLTEAFPFYESLSFLAEGARAVSVFLVSVFLVSFLLRKSMSSSYVAEGLGGIVKALLASVILALLVLLTLQRVFDVGSLGLFSEGALATLESTGAFFWTLIATVLILIFGRER
jgi:hypothetical protein